MPKGPPRVLESERAAIGTAIRNQEPAEILATELKVDDFTDETCRKVFKAIESLTSRGLEVNQVSIQEASGIPGEKLDELRNKAKGINPGSLKTLIAELQRVSGLRTVYMACRQGMESIQVSSELESVTAQLENTLYASDRNGASEASDGASVGNRVVASFLERVANGGGAEISTGLKELDRAIIGLQPGKMVVIAGRPSMGKTALADTIRRAVIGQGFGAIQFSLEMSEDEILERELAFQSGLNLRKILSAKDVKEDELQRVRSVSWDGMGERWYIDDRTSSITGIRRRARILSGRMSRQGIKTGLVILDYIQLAGENGDGREQSVAAISRGCKLMAKELGCSVLALSQLNRQCENRDDKRPLMSDLRESGSIEQDADIVGFVYREHIYSNDVPPEEAELIIRKHRSGPTGTVPLVYNPQLVSFVNPNGGKP